MINTSSTTLKRRVSSKKNKINIITLGCFKNLVDSEGLMGQLKAHGFEVVHESTKNDFDTVIINTCGFIGDAKEESINTIIQFAEARKKGMIKKIFVVGCLSERYQEELKKNIPEFDKFFGIDKANEILKELKAIDKEYSYGERIITTPSHYAYLKIADGCNNHCSFCAIPLIRGKHHSRIIEDIVKEANSLADNGVKEIILIAQDLTYYGLDNYKKRKIADLLRELVKVKGIEWIRLQYAYPTNFPMDMLQVMKKNSKICKYLDISFQHVSDRILKSMKRNFSKQQSFKFIEKIREKIPGIALRTSLIVGYPNETEKEFQELVDFIKTIQFDRLGVFKYSHEEGTAAYKMKDNVSANVKQNRMDELMKIQQRISFELNKQKTGKIFRVLIDRLEDGYYVGRTEFDSPEVDNEVLIEKENSDIKIGQLCNIKINTADEYDLFGERI